MNTQTINNQIHRIEESTLNLVTMKINLFSHKFFLCAPSSMLHLVCKNKAYKTTSLQLAFIRTQLIILHIGTSSWWFHQVNLGPLKAISMSSQSEINVWNHSMRMIFWSQNLFEIIHYNPRTRASAKETFHWSQFLPKLSYVPLKIRSIYARNHELFTWM